MQFLKKTVFPIFLIGIWINLSETIRWMFLIEKYWLEKYEGLHIIFPNGMVNMIAWMVWGFCLASIIFMLSGKFKLIPATFIAWISAFAMMWIVVWNVGVLPTGMLWFNIPMSFLEILIAVIISNWLLRKPKTV